MISVIVPVYNAEKYLAKCLNSIVNQTFRDLEIILIDDGSTDSSGNICDQYAQRDARIIVIHQSNRGISAARNIGISRATSDYITFIDSDDYIELDTYEVVNYTIIKYSPDLVLFREKSVDLKGKTISVNGSKPSNNVYIKDRSFAEELIIGNLVNGMCDKVYRASIVKTIKFNEGKANGEDFLYNMYAIQKVQTVGYIDQIKYSYVTTPNSITRRGFTPALFDQIYYKDKIANIAKERFPTYSRICEKRAYLSRLHTCRAIYSAKLEKQYIKEVNSFKEYLKKNHGRNKLNAVENSEYFALLYSKPLYTLLLKILALRYAIRS